MARPWLAAASLDRYLHRIRRPQVFGTLFTNKDVTSNDGWTMEPYNRELLAPSLLEANCVPDRHQQSEMLKAVRRGEDLLRRSENHAPNRNDDRGFDSRGLRPLLRRSRSQIHRILPLPTVPQ